MNDRRIAILLSLVFVIVLVFTTMPLKSEITCLSDQQFYSELLAIDGIGPILADRIIDYRRHYPYADPADFIAVDGIGGEKVKQIKRKFK